MASFTRVVLASPSTLLDTVEKRKGVSARLRQTCRIPVPDRLVLQGPPLTDTISQAVYGRLYSPKASCLAPQPLTLR